MSTNSSGPPTPGRGNFTICAADIGETKIWLEIVVNWSTKWSRSSQTGSRPRTMNTLRVNKFQIGDYARL